jgi:hypothetical protein
VKKNSKTLRFDVDYKTRLEQQRTANNAVRLPRMGYELYRIYVIEEPKKESSHTMMVSKSRQTGKSQANWQAVLWAFIDELESRTEPAYEVKWLKPKQTTLLRMRGHRVEPAQPGDRVGHVGPIDKPVRLGR